MRLAVVVLALAACGTNSPGPHDIVDCVDWKINGGMPFTGKCERACQIYPVGGTDTAPLCRANGPCHAAFDDGNGHAGCCLPDAVPPNTIRFYACP